MHQVAHHLKFVILLHSWGMLLLRHHNLLFLALLDNLMEFLFRECRVHRRKQLQCETISIANSMVDFSDH